MDRFVAHVRGRGQIHAHNDDRPPDREPAHEAGAEAFIPKDELDLDVLRGWFLKGGEGDKTSCVERKT